MLPPPQRSTVLRNVSANPSHRREFTGYRRMSTILSCETCRHEHRIGLDLQHSLDTLAGEEVVHNFSMADTAIAMFAPADSSMPTYE
jgi:hypothetical protein